MTVAALPGNVRYRALQLGEQSSFGTPVAATRRVPFRFNPTVDPHWTTPDVDTGTLDPAQSPYRTAIDVTGQLVGPLSANDAQILWAALLKGGVTPTGGPAYSWSFQPATATADVFELLTAEWGDEVVADQWQYQDGILSQVQLQFPQDLGPIMVTADARFGSVTYPHTLTAGLSVAVAPPWLYAADTALYMDSTAGSIGVTQLLNTMRDATITINTNPDVKRFSNGSNGNFAVAGYGRGARTMETAFTMDKSAAACQEFANWLNASPVERFVVLDTTSRQFITGSTPYQQKIKWAGYWFTRQEGSIGSNTTVQLVCHHVVDSGLAAAIDIKVVNAQATLLPASL